jgi:predicted transcriptional regulator of viral defense system
MSLFHIFLQKCDNMTLMKSLKNLEKLGVFTRSDIKRIGLPRSLFYKLIQEGKIEKLAHGFYLHIEASNFEPEEIDFIVACKKFGDNAVIGGLSALARYNLIEEIPRQIWVLVPDNKQTKSKLYRLIRTTHPFSDIGIEKHTHYRITTLERTLVEALIYASKIGLDTAVGAIVKAVKNKQTSLSKIGNMAEKMNKKDIIKKHWLSITGAISA